jgi:DNA-directed RNA polymerase specialized sigma subunit
MIRSEAEYQVACKRLDEDRDFALQQKTALEAQGFTPEQVERGLEATLSYHAQLAEEVDWYEKVRRREIAPLANLTQIGRLLIGLRIANGLSQRELADRLCVSEAAVSRDERNEYHGVTVEKAQRVLEALVETVIASVAGTTAPSHGGAQAGQPAAT